MERGKPTPGPQESPPLAQKTHILIKRLVKGFVLPHRRRLALALLMMVIVAASTALLAREVQPLLNDVFIARDRSRLNTVALSILLIFLAKGIASYIEEVLMNGIGQTIVSSLQSAMFRALVRADLAFFHSTQTALLITRLTNDVGLLRTVVTNSLTGIGKDFLSVVFLAAVMFWQDWRLSLVALVVFPLAIMPIAKQGKRMRKVSTNTQDEVAKFAVRLEQIFQGNRHVKAYGMEGYETGRIEKIIASILILVKRAGRVRALASPIMETLGGIAIVVVVIIGGLQVIEGTRDTGSFFSFITALLLAYEPVKRLANLNTSLQEALAAAQRVFAIVDLAPKITSLPNAKPLKVTQGRIEFRKVSFSYQTTDKDSSPDSQNESARDSRSESGKSASSLRALSNINFTVAAGQRVALVGRSGGGKSTLLNLISRFYDPQSGAIFIDGQNIRQIELDSLRKSIALVSQDSMLFDDTVRANIAYGEPSASFERIVAAAKHAAADDFIRNLPHGYDTEVGEFGAKLSGGQRQRIAIARAMLRDAPILLLDEATSALDSQSERQVQKALDELMQGRTVIVIAHRLSTIVGADVICVIDAGKIVETGSHDQLLKYKGLYSQLYKTYKKSEDNSG